MIDNAACLDCGHPLSICEHAAQRLADPMVSGQCGCASTAPTYPTYRSELHLTGCPWRAISDLRAELDAVRAEAQALQAALSKADDSGMYLGRKALTIDIAVWNAVKTILARPPDERGVMSPSEKEDKP
jgi:hypothetical protein